MPAGRQALHQWAEFDFCLINKWYIYRFISSIALHNLEFNFVTVLDINLVRQSSFMEKIVIAIISRYETKFSWFIIEFYFSFLHCYFSIINILEILLYHNIPIKSKLEKWILTLLYSVFNRPENSFHPVPKEIVIVHFSLTDIMAQWVLLR